MSFIEDIYGSVGRLSAFDELHVEASALPAAVLALGDASLRDLLAETTGLIKRVSTLQSVLAGVASSRSGRDRGHGGFTQQTGHRNAVELLRDLTGATRGEAIRAVKVGEALLDGLADAAGEPVAATVDAVPPADPWHQPLREALLASSITTAQLHVIRDGLGAPPTIDGRDVEAVIAAWRAACRELAREAATCTVEDLAARARSVRAMLDPAGAEERWSARFDRRSYRWSTTSDGLRQAHITFDDEMGEWVRGFLDAAHSPRRGGPRFVSEDEKRAAVALVDDPRSNEQLAYDLFVDILRAGSLAEAEDVFGAREAGVRLVTMTDAATGDTVVRDALGRLVNVAHSEDGAIAVPGSVLERALCATGAVEVTVDTCGNPLDVGREQRLFTPRQRLALAIRDGGCLWPGCDRPPAYCEAHHCDHWKDGGRTDCTVGVLLCRFHHLHLHNCGWRISRTSAGDLLLHAPAGIGGEPIVLPSKSPLRWLWDPPPERGGWRSAA